MCGLVPKKFLCRYSLGAGAVVAAIILIVITVASMIDVLVQMLSVNRAGVPRRVWKSLFSFTITIVVYDSVMILLHVLMLWGVKKRISSVMVLWVVITSIWLAQITCQLLVLLILYGTTVSLVSCILSVVFGAIAVCILAYMVLIVYGLYVQIKRERMQY